MLPYCLTYIALPSLPPREGVLILLAGMDQSCQVDPPTFCLVAIFKVESKELELELELRKDKLGDKIGFWDVVVITAADDEQAEIYREQVRWRQELGQIPSSCTYHVVPDPPGCKIGNGGATLVVLDYLRTEYKSKFVEKKYLVIHAGGYSQRTPQHSVCGKIFAPLPVGPLPGSSMLEMCFAMLCDIPSRVFPGAVMIKCGDDVIIFDGDVCQWDL